MVTIRSSAPERWRGVNCISSLTWASCLAYLCRRQPRPDDRVSKSCTPTSFFVYSQSGETDTKIITSIVFNDYLMLYLNFIL